MTPTPSDIEAELRDLATYFIGYAWSAFDNKKPEMVVDKFKELLHQYAEKREREARIDEISSWIDFLNPDYGEDVKMVRDDLKSRLAQLNQTQEGGE